MSGRFERLKERERVQHTKNKLIYLKHQSQLELPIGRFKRDIKITNKTSNEIKRINESYTTSNRLTDRKFHKIILK